MLCRSIVQFIRLTRIFCPVLVAIFLGIIQTGVASASLFATLGIDADAGVDEATRSWLSTLPQQWRDQINKIVEDTLTSADAHLDQDLIKIREQLALAEDEAACTWQGVNLATIQLWQSEIPFLKQKEPIRDLENYISHQRKEGLDHKLDPVYMQLLYDDLQNKVGVIRCEPNLSEGSKVNLASMSAGLSAQWTLWRRMDFIHCGDQSTCFMNYRSTVDRSLDDAQKLVGLTDVEKNSIAAAKGEVSSIKSPSTECGYFFRGLTGKDCYDVDDFESQLLALGTVDDRLRIIVAAHTLHEKMDGAVIVTQDVDPGTLNPGSTLKSPNNKYFAVLQNNCNFQIFKGAYTTSANLLASKYVVANTATANSSYSNCHLDLQRDRNLTLYADVTTTVMKAVAGNAPGPFGHVPHFVSSTSTASNQPVWTSKTSDGGNGDYWLVLLDSGQIELHAGAPFSDGGALEVSRLVVGKTIDFSPVTKSP